MNDKLLNEGSIKMKKKTVAVVIVGALLAAAVLPLISYFQESNGNDNVVFEYNGKKVYETEVKPYVEYYMKINSMNDLETKNYAVDNYIRSLLLSEFSKDMGMTVNDNEIFEYINKSAIFHDNDEFSKQKYDDLFASYISFNASSSMTTGISFILILSFSITLC